MFCVPKSLILKWHYMWVLHVGLGLHFKLFKSPMGYIEMNWIHILHLGLSIHIILQYPHVYLFSPTRILALFFWIIK
jgi:hypothetical protein